MITPRRNDPCPCGSGLKYKKCCLPRSFQSYHEPDDIASRLASAYKLMSEENWQEAVETFNSLLAVASEPCAILEALAACYDGMEKYLLAAECYERALSVSPESRRPELYYRLGVSRACAQRIDEARDAFRASQDLQRGQGGKDRIGRILDQFDRIGAGDCTPYFFFVQVQLQRAFSEMDTERYDAAAARLERLAGVDPENSAIFYNMGVVYTFLKREEDALEQFRRSVELEPGYFQAWYNMGQIHLLKKKDLSLALNCFDRAVMINPHYVSAHHQRGVVHELLGNSLEAVECWERTLEIDPDNRQARQSLDRLHRTCHCRRESPKEN
jgi:protein O-GlcNAc transferase